MGEISEIGKTAMMERGTCECPVCGRLHHKLANDPQPNIFERWIDLNEARDLATLICPLPALAGTRIASVRWNFISAAR